MEILSSIIYVDDVVVINDRDKKNQFLKYRYNRLFVGDDWKGSDIFNDLNLFLSKYDSEIFYFNYTKNISSSKLKSVLESIYEQE